MSGRTGSTGGAVNANVALGLVTSFTSGLADSIWTGTVYAGYLYALSSAESKPNTLVGVAEAAIGTTTLVCALPVGYLADKYPRHHVIRFGGVTMMLAVAVTCYAVMSGEATEAQRHHQYGILLVASSLWGLCSGITNGPVQALFADSIPTGDRSKYYTWLYASYFLPSCVGPLICIALFQGWCGPMPASHGADDSGHWSMSELRPVLLVGVLLEVPCAISLFFFHSNKALQEDGNPRRDTVENPSPAEGPAVDGEGGEGEAGEAGASQGSTKETGLKFGCLRQGAIPYIIFGADMITALASGMTIKFFPLFFKNTVKLSPSAVQAIYVVVPLTMVMAATSGQWASKTLGRVQVILLARTVGVSCLFLMVFLKDHQQNWKVMIPIYILRTAANNSCYPLEESIQMDFVAKNTRARWKSLESVMQFGWCGSAVLGGVLSDGKGGDYSFTFMITACMQAAGGLALLPLLALVPRKEALDSPEGVAAADGAGGDDGEAAVREPLLGSGSDSED